MRSERVGPTLTEITSVGCGRKLPPLVLKRFLSDVDIDGSLAPHVGDDCGVTDSGVGEMLLHTVDIVLPMGLDPITWGKIVALHCASDIYASGGRPTWATGIVQISQDWLDNDWHIVSYRAAVAQLRELGVLVVGGHSLRNTMTSMGFSITGRCRSGDLRLRKFARPGDALVLTKPIGGGLILGANAFGNQCDLNEGDLDEVVDSMMLSNEMVSEEASALGVRSSTDISGFGLLGSCLEIATEAGVQVEIRLAEVPIFIGVHRALEVGAVSPLAESIMIDSETCVEWSTASVAEKLTLCDPQVSGGLLLAMPLDLAMNRFVPTLADRGQASWIIGELREMPGKTDRNVVVT
jgi:selenide,water dikinase